MLFLTSLFMLLWSFFIALNPPFPVCVPGHADEYLAVRHIGGPSTPQDFGLDPRCLGGL